MGVAAIHLNADKISVNQRFPGTVASGESFVVELEISKGSFNGFAKWQQSFPQGFVAEMMETRGGTFSFKDNILKLIWLELPSEETFTISYRVAIDPSVPLSEYKFGGKYSYLLKSGKKEIFPEKETIVVADKASVLNPGLLKENNKLEEEVIDLDAQIRRKKELEQLMKIGAGADQVIVSYNDLKPIKDEIIYRIQIAAGHEKLSYQALFYYFEMNESVSTEFHDGWRKYTIGQFSTYQSARKKRNELRNDRSAIEGAFVTAYREGQRISISEALEVSREKWVN